MEYLPQDQVFGKNSVELSAVLMCMECNHGSVMYSQVLQEMGITPGVYTEAANVATVHRQVAKGERKSTDVAQQARKRGRVRKGIEDEDDSRELLRLVYEYEWVADSLSGREDSFGVKI